MGQSHQQNILFLSALEKSEAKQSVVTATAPLLLDEYIRRVVGSSSSSSSSSTFPTRHRSSPAILARGRTNHVLLYNGCFNPPHRGHLAHLVHAIRHAGPDLNIVGAVVLVADDLYLKWKLAGQRGALNLKLKQRIRLWEGELELIPEGERCWVLSETLWPGHADKLEQLFKKDGVDVEFVRLAGGDKVRVAAVEHGVWGCQRVITTDVSRPVDFYSSSVGDVTLPMPLNRHGEWKRVGERQGKDGSDEGVGSETLITESTVISSSSTTSISTPQTSRNIWTCDHGPSGSYYNVRFIASSRDERVDPDLSSTKIRGIIAASKKLDVGQLEEKLQGIALCPGLLALYIKEAK
ncbi:hypothetical protein GL218_05965 [Daldinia childiae]|uniref:uncharacterized protein n=1 Tax=Daldinia childiae TaxID=326645 RepID=UPI0014478C82|nr:uncharacterized protein GL218_05965 [Daldinia childiae]KAF3057350.1 hypothetical protein GL218_05965 [Daldinia childiae]